VRIYLPVWNLEMRDMSERDNEYKEKYIAVQMERLKAYWAQNGWALGCRMSRSDFDPSTGQDPEYWGYHRGADGFYYLLVDPIKGGTTLGSPDRTREDFRSAVVAAAKQVDWEALQGESDLHIIIQSVLDRL